MNKILDLMRKIFLAVGLAAGLCACGGSPNQGKRLAPDAFSKICKDGGLGEGAAAGESSTNLQQRLLTTGMQFSVSVNEDTSLNRTYAIGGGCAVDIAAVGRIAVCGLTTDELAAKIKAVLERDYFAHATVAVAVETAYGPAKAGNGGLIYLFGEVAHPGPLQLPPSEILTVTKVILAAGGFTTFSRGDEVRVVRYCEDGKKYETIINVNRIMKYGEPELDVPVRPNDWIIVPQKLLSFF